MRKHALNQSFRVAIVFALVTVSAASTGCRNRFGVRLPWSDTLTITDDASSVPPVRITQAEDRHLVQMRVPSGGWTLMIDRGERVPNGRRVYLTATRPDPAFMHIQAQVDLSVLTGVDADSEIEAVVRVLDHGDRPSARVYARVVPVESFQD